MRILLVPLAVGVLAGCARFEPRPIAPADTASQLDQRRLDAPALKSFLEQNLHRELAPWPLAAWDLKTLTLAAYYYQPSLDLARAQWAVARGGEITAGQRPNPSLNVTPGYDVTTLVPSPWIPLGFLDVPLETAGKRGYRRAQSQHLSEAARLNIATVAWQIRSDVRSAALDLAASGQREALLGEQLRLQINQVQMTEEQVRAGALAGSDALTFRIAQGKTQLDLADSQRQRAEARARLAEAIGIPAAALEGIKLVLPPHPDGIAALTSAEARHLALISRPDILGALAEYAAAQSALQLEIAKQYPDVHVAPGYQYDQGDSKWSLGLTVELPVLNHNQGPIAEARARRDEVAARFNALQAKVLAEIDRAVAVFRTTETNATTLRSLAREQAKRQASVAAQYQAGAVEHLDLLNAQLEAATAALLQLDGQIKLQQAFGTLEDAVRRPLTLPPAIYESSRNDAH